MRSRFSDFAVGDVTYLSRTWHPTTRPRRIGLDPAQRWTRREVIGATGGGLLDPDGTVAFRAHYRLDGRAGVLCEHSRFVRHDGRWAYLGPVPSAGADVGGRAR